MAKKKNNVDIEPWERQDGETVKQFNAFVIYRDMGEDRSLSKVAQQLNKTKALMGRWSAANNWVERCVAWDREQDRIARQEQIKDIKKMRKRHADTGALMLSISRMALKNMIDTSDEKNPKLRDDIELNATEISRLVDAGSKLERVSRGDVGDVIEHRDGGEAMNAVQIYIPDNNRGRDKDTFDDLEV